MAAYCGPLTSSPPTEYVWEAFTSDTAPTVTSHGDKYRYVMGPFHTLLDARSFVFNQVYKSPFTPQSTSYHDVDCPKHPDNRRKQSVDSNFTKENLQRLQTE